MSTKAVDVRIASTKSRCRRPLFSSHVSAGFPSPADDHVEKSLDLNEHLIQHPEATYFVRAAGESMTGAGIHNGDLLIVDRAIEPVSGNIVIAVIDGELTVKRFHKRNGKLMLLADNPAYKSIAIKAETDCTIWGVVKHVVHPV